MKKGNKLVCMQISPKRLKASENLGIDIIYQHEEAIDYDEVSALLQKVTLHAWHQLFSLVW